MNSASVSFRGPGLGGVSSSLRLISFSAVGEKCELQMWRVGCRCALLKAKKHKSPSPCTFAVFVKETRAVRGGQKRSEEKQRTRLSDPTKPPEPNRFKKTTRCCRLTAANLRLFTGSTGTPSVFNTRTHAWHKSLMASAKQNVF